MQTQTEEILQTQPQLVEKEKNNKRITIGVPREMNKLEKRVPLTPLAVSEMVSLGHKIIIETGAGKGANYTDNDYRNAGARISNTKKDVFKSEYIAKVAPFLSKDIEFLHNEQTIFSALHISAQSKDNIQQLVNKNITAIAFEYFKDANNFNPFVHLMSEISGSTSVMIAAELLSNVSGGKGVMLGGLTGIAPTEIVIIGTGTSTEYATRIAMGLGATVKVFDNSISELISIQKNLGRNIFTSTLNHKVLAKALLSADVVINTKEKEYETGYIITNQMVKSMKPDTVIIDLKIDYGSVIETSKITSLEKPTYREHDVIHYCVPNIASRVARTASIAISNILSPLLKQIINSNGIISYMKENSGLRNGTYILKGILTNPSLGNEFDLSSKDINLLMAAF